MMWRRLLRVWGREYFRANCKTRNCRQKSSCSLILQKHHKTFTFYYRVARFWKTHEMVSSLCRGRGRAWKRMKWERGSPVERRRSRRSPSCNKFKTNDIILPVRRPITQRGTHIWNRSQLYPAWRSSVARSEARQHPSEPFSNLQQWRNPQNVAFTVSPDSSQCSGQNCCSRAIINEPRK